MAGSDRCYCRAGLWLLLILCVGAWTGRSDIYAQEPESDALIELVVGLLNDPDQDVRALAFEQVRTEAPGAKATEQFAAQLPKLPADGQVGLLRALGARGDSAARKGVLEYLRHADVSVRSAAIDALGGLGNVDDLPPLIEVLQQGSEDERAGARKSLERLPGDMTSQAIAERLSQAESALQVALIEILQARRAFDTAPKIVPLATGNDAQVRRAAMTALGDLGGVEQIPGMVQGVLRAERGAERVAAEKGLMFVCHRIAAPESGAGYVLQASEKLSAKDRLTLLSALGRIGGKESLAEIEKAIASPEGATRTTGVNALANWPDASVAARLIELANSKPYREQQTVLLRALIRVSVLADSRSDEARLDLLKKAMAMCQRPEERRLALQRASAIRTPESLRFVLPFVDQSEYMLQACESICDLAHHRNLREPNKVEFDAALDKVMAICKDEVLIDRARRYKNNQTWVRPK